MTSGEHHELRKDGNLNALVTGLGRSSDNMSKSTGAIGQNVNNNNN